MAVIFFYIKQNNTSEVEVKIEKHDGEKETDLSYKWAKYAMDMVIQMNFNILFANPFVEDQGAQLHFLTKKIIIDNNLNEYGYKNEDNAESKDIFIDDSDLEDIPFFEDRITFDLDDINESIDIMINDESYVHILLDLHEASKQIGGFTTPTATAATAVYSSTKKHAYNLSK